MEGIAGLGGPEVGTVYHVLGALRSQCGCSETNQDQK